MSIAEGDTPMTALTLADVSALLHRASMAKSRISEMELTAKADHERIDAMLKEETGPDRRLIADATAQIEEYWRCRVAEMEQGEKKSRNLGWGRIAAKSQQPDFKRDESVLLPWAERNGYIRLPEPKPEVDWDRLKKAGRVVGGEFRVDGNPVPGVEVIPRPDSITVVVD